MFVRETNALSFFCEKNKYSSDDCFLTAYCRVLHSGRNVPCIPAGAAKEGLKYCFFFCSFLCYLSKPLLRSFLGFWLLCNISNREENTSLYKMGILLPFFKMSWAYGEGCSKQMVPNIPIHDASFFPVGFFSLSSRILHTSPKILLASVVRS